MPIERRPVAPRTRGIAPAGSRPQAHRVADGETFETVARKYGVPVETLIRHNFGTLDTAEVNWYLREHVGCTRPTRDGRNWCFSSAARPGLLYLPRAVLQMEPLHITGGPPAPPVALDGPGLDEILPSVKFSHEFKLPPNGPRDLGYLLIQARINVEGELKQDSDIVKSSIKKGQLKLAVEQKLSDVTKGTLALKFDEKSLKPIAEAIASGDRNRFMRALAAPIELSVKTGYKLGNVTIVPELGGELSTTPLIVRVSGDFEDYLPIDGTLFKGKFVVKIGFNVGLSARGWRWVVEKVGRPVLQRFLTTGGRAFASVSSWLVSEGVILGGAVAIGAVVGTVAVTSLVAWLAQDARHKGELRGLAVWYVSAYVARVFREPRPTGFITGSVQLRDELVTLGERDAVADARAILTKVGDPAARGTDAAALEAYRIILTGEANGREGEARRRLRVALEAKSQALAGL